MSSISSFSGCSSFNSNMLNPQTSKIDKLKLHVCPGCNRHYDLFLRSGIFVGRVPLILNCNHTLCEECIRLKFQKGEIICVDCKQPSKVDVDLKLKLQDLFPVNFYLAGSIYYNKPHQTDNSKISLKPVGVSYRNRMKVMGVNNQFRPNDRSNLHMLKFPNVGAFQERCCQTTCQKPANVRCFECNEVYCASCSEAIHKVARGLQLHKITPMTSDFLPLINEKCKVHLLPLEFCCNSCNTVECCYCVVHNHTGHNYYQLSFLNDADRPGFNELLLNAEEKLRKLLFAYQKASHELNNACTQVTASPAETEIGQYFANIHARLQVVEDQLQKDLFEKKNSNAIALNNITSELAGNIRNLNGLINTGRSVMYNAKSEVKLNVKVIMERLENVLMLPCYLVGQQQTLDSLGFECGDLLDNLESNFCISANHSAPFQIVAEDALPDNYDTTLPDDMSLMSLEDINSIVNNSGDLPSGATASAPNTFAAPKFLSPGDLLASALQPKSDGSSTASSVVEKWVHNSTEELKKSSSVPTLKIEDRENIIVTHIDTPESFYVQLARLKKYLHNLGRDIEQQVRNFAPTVNTPELNKLYIVKYEEKDSKSSWCRGRIIDIILGANGKEQQYAVHFIDYGNTSIVSRNMLREINSSLAKLKPFALQCKLMNVYPVGSEWEPKTMKFMAQIISESEIIMVVLNNSEGILEVDLIAMPNGASIRDALVFIGDAIPCIQGSGALSETSFKSSKPLPKLHKRTERFTSGQSVNVFISHVVDPYNIYVQLADFAHHISHTSDVMATYYNNKINNKNNRAHIHVSKTENIYVPKKDMIVAVRYGAKWFRGSITKKHDGKGSVDVFLVDIGKTITVSYTDLRKLAERFRTLECQAILVKMVHIQPNNFEERWDICAKNFLDPYSKNNYTLRMLVYEPLTIPPEVLLFEPYATLDKCINAMMVQTGVATATSEASLQVNWHKESPAAVKEASYVFDLLDTIQSTKKTKGTDSDSEDDGTLTNIVRKPISILRSISPDLIYVKLNDEKSESAMHELDLDIQNYYSRIHATPQTWKENDPCVAFNHLTKSYGRAVILKEIENNQFQVLLRDTAEEIVVDTQNIYVLENQFIQAHEGALRCHMSGIIPAGDSKKWSLLSIDFLQNIFQQGNNIFISKNAPVDKNRKSLCVEFWYSEFKPGAALEPSKTIYHSINKQLVKNGLALRVRTDPPVVETLTTTSETTVEAKETKSGNQDVRINANKDQNSRIVRSKYRHSYKTTDDAVITSIPVTKIETEMYHSTDAAFVHPIVDQDVPKSIDNKEVEQFQKVLASLSKSSSPSHNLNTVPSSCFEVDGVSDWNEIIKNDEPTELHQVPKEITDWLPPELFPDKSFFARATFVDDNAHIYLHDVKYEKGLQEMEIKMKAVFDTLPSEPKGTVWVPGQICTVKYFVTDSWYRGRIIEANDDHIKVFMLDYGNVEECKHDDLRFKVMYTNLPAFANKVQLFKVFPKNNEKWLTSDLDELHRTVVDNKVHVVLKGNVKPNIATPAVLKVDGTNINEWMLQKSTNLSPFRVKESVVPDTTDDVIIEDNQSSDVIIEAIMASNLAPPNVTYLWKPLNKSLENQEVSVGIVNILNFDKFIIEFVDDANANAKDLFETVSEDIKKRAPEQPPLENLQLGQACVARFSEDGEWYRGQVYNLENISLGLVEIWFVDFGNFENVPIGSVCTTDPSWLELPVQQYVCQIYGVGISDESKLNNAINELNNLCNTIKTAEIISIEPLLVQLYEDNHELCYKNLIEKNILHYRK